MEEMFSNPGQRIRSWAKGLFVVECICLIIAFFYYWIDQSDFWKGLLVLLCGVAAAYIFCLFIIAFGELVQTNEENAKTNHEILMYLKHQNRQENPKPAKVADPPKATEPVVPSVQTEAVRPIKKLPKNNALAKILKEALTYQSDDKMRMCLEKILINRELSQYWGQVQEIFEEVPRNEQRKAVEELLQMVQ